MTYPIRTIEDIDPDEAAALRSIGIRTTEKLLEAAKSPKGRKLLASRTKFDEKTLLRWANIADKLRIKGIRHGICRAIARSRRSYSQGIAISKSREARPTMAETNKKRKFVRFLPSEKLVTRWVEHARKLPQKITY